jgi:DnaJ-class molecular chaperone
MSGTYDPSEYGAERCGLCLGRGIVTEYLCPSCYGKGMLLVQQPPKTCSACKGAGRALDQEGSDFTICAACSGTGWEAFKRM